MMAPPFDFIERSFLPIINRMGPTVTTKLIRHGFYPRGGGRIELDITPAPLRPIDCIERGEPLAQSAEVRFAHIPPAIAVRMMVTLRKQLPDWPDDAFVSRELPEDQGPGVILMLSARYANATEIVSGFGQLGVPAERLAKTAAARMRGFAATDAFAGPYLADQLLLPFAIAGGGRFSTVKLSQHSRTAMDIIEKFLPVRFAIIDDENGKHSVTIGMPTV
jgi:RNA 3'-terminal phosphate cyclase (ATP)